MFGKYINLRQESFSVTLCDAFMQLLGLVCFSLPTCVVLVVTVVLQKRASKVTLIPFGFETLEIQAQAFSLSLS